MQRVSLPALVAGFLLSGFVNAAAHSWYGWECCHDRDCAPVDSAEIQVKPGGYLIVRTGEFVSVKEAKQGRDEDYHVCRDPSTGKLICLYIPNSGS